ncbi:MAG: hypothetical protein K0Q92_3557 [Steroidobacteraceae bacterium]|jgi:hypothetical protein|nr:hypothetical protein [Steroidobacteraceae bacterium]
MNKLVTKFAASCLVAFGLGSPGHGQELTPEQQAVFDEMIRQSGGDPALVNAARAQAQVAANYGDVVRYTVTGVYQGRTNVSADSNWMAFADVGDRVSMQFDWQVSEARLLGTVAIQNHAATLANPRNPEPKCAPPTINGPFDYDLRAVEQGIGGTLRLHVQTRAPAVQVHQFCTGTLKPIAARNSLGHIEFMVPPPTMLAMQLPATGTITRSSDGKSLVHQQGGWRWTFTPRSK